MDQYGLRASSRPEEAEWIGLRLAPFGSGVAAIVPGGFPAYVRILHPARGSNGEAVRWAGVAAASGRTMHRLVQFHAIDQPAVSGPGISVDPPATGNLEPDLLRILCGHLAEHTNTLHSCWFCLWEGYGWVPDNSSSAKVVFTPVGASPSSFDDETDPDSLTPGLRAALLNAPCIHLPARDYFLCEGPLQAATQFGWTVGTRLLPQSPNLFWPEDRAWCVASEIDLVCTLVGGSDALAESLLADTRLEAWRVFADDPVTWDSDYRNHAAY